MSVSGVNIIIAGAYEGAKIEERSYNSGIVEVVTKSGFFSRTVHATFDGNHVEAMTIINRGKEYGDLLVELDMRTVEVVWKNGQKSLIKVTAPLYDKMLAGMYR